MHKKNVAVIFGGVSTEHDVSLVSAGTVIRNLNKDKYNLYFIGITSKGEFLYYTGDEKLIEQNKWESSDTVECVISPSRKHHGMIVLSENPKVIPLDVVIPVLHGKNGEDGTVQGLLQLAGISFVGCDALSSAVCMDKQMTHVVLDNAGIKTARWVSVTKSDLNEETLKSAEALGYPLFVKPANAGSSFGVSKATDRQSLIKAIENAFLHDKKAVIEEAIVGKEVECAVLGPTSSAKASVAGEIEPANDFYDFEAKYQNADSKLHIPARISDKTMNELRQIALKAYKALGCSGLSRVDFFVTESEEIILNEVNTFPGFTSISMYPKLWNACGKDTPELLDELIECALMRE